MIKKAFIFDLDGVIVDTARYHFFAWQKIAAELGVEFTPEHNEKLKGVSRVRSLEIILALGGINARDEDRERWLHQKNGCLHGNLQLLYRDSANHQRDNRRATGKISL